MYFKIQKRSEKAFNAEPNKITAAQWFNMNNLLAHITEHALLAINELKKRTYYSEMDNKN